MTDFEKGKFWLIRQNRQTIIIGSDYANNNWKHKLLHLENQEIVKEIIKNHFRKLS